MLSEIQCAQFSQLIIKFKNGLNIILGDDDAKNSIGKSTALMVIDFAHGGDSFLDDEAGVIKALGHHYYNFSFIFDENPYFFSRSTDVPEIVYICDKDYERKNEISIDDYRKTLKELYKLSNLEHSFRSLVSPFSRIWKKGALEPDQPFVADTKEQTGFAISRLIDIFRRSDDIASEKKVLDEQKERKKLISGSMNANIIPGINKTQFKSNNELIASNTLQIDQLKQGFAGALSAYEALFDENLQRLQQRKNQVMSLRSDLQAKIKRLQREISGITPRLAANIALVAEYFPTVNVERLEKVEAFHQKIGSIVKKELKDELSLAEAEERVLSNEYLSLENTIQSALSSKGMPDDLFKRVFELKEATDRALNENEYFERKKQLEETIKATNNRLEEIYSNIFLEIERKINQKLSAFNKVVYGPTRNSSQLRIKSANSYSFTSPDDTGTGKSFAGLIGFDIAILSLTQIPFAIHDSVIYKNIEVAATRRILRILAAMRRKQVFLSFDEAHKFGIKAEKTIRKSTVLKLSHKDLLYKKDWRDVKIN